MRRAKRVATGGLSGEGLDCTQFAYDRSPRVEARTGETASEPRERLAMSPRAISAAVRPSWSTAVTTTMIVLNLSTIIVPRETPAPRDHVDAPTPAPIERPGSPRP